MLAQASIERRIIGIETEFGCAQGALGYPRWPNTYWDERLNSGGNCEHILDDPNSDQTAPCGKERGCVLPNGSRLYTDITHPELGSAEALGFVNAFATHVASMRVCQGYASAPLYNNNVDEHGGTTFGTHENYLIHSRLWHRIHSHEMAYEPTAERELWAQWLVIRQLICGAGRFHLDSSYEIGQKSSAITRHAGEVAGKSGMFDHRNDPAMSRNLTQRFLRLHVTIGDGHTLHAAILMQLGMTELVLRALEDGYLQRAFKHMRYSTYNIFAELSQISQFNWQMSRENGSIRAIDLLERFHQVIKHAYYGSVDAPTRTIIDWWGFCIKELRAIEPFAARLRDGSIEVDKLYPLSTICDWVRKLLCIRLFEHTTGTALTADERVNQDLAYHCLHRDHSLLSDAERHGAAKDIVSASIIDRHMYHAPEGTRAGIRSIVGKFAMENGLPDTALRVGWGGLYLPQINRQRMYSTGDPFETYLGRVHKGESFDEKKRVRDAVKKWLAQSD